MFNPALIIAIVVQGVVAKFSRMTGAILGYAISTGILVWGLTTYGGGNTMVFFGISLPEPLFLALCLVWYGLDTRELLAARKAGDGHLPLPAFLLLWFLTYVLAAIASTGLSAVFIRALSDNLVVAGLITSVLASAMLGGFLQWMLLSLVIPHANRRFLAIWIPVSISGWVIGNILSLVTTLPPASLLLSAASGLTIGMLQWLILRKYSRIAYWWIPVCVVEWAAPLIIAPMNTPGNAFQFGIANFLVGVACWILSSIAMVVILRKQVPDSRPEMQSVPVSGI